MSRPYRVHSGVEIPPVKRAGRRGGKYPFSTMAVGEMFFIPIDDLPKSFSSQRNAAQRRYGRKYIARTVVMDGREGVGCWRVASEEVAALPAEYPVAKKPVKSLALADPPIQPPSGYRIGIEIDEPVTAALETPYPAKPVDAVEIPKELQELLPDWDD